ncbi:metal ABC transporter solute-binding protein, Zn/Mn family [Salinispora arenicola]|uniref:metal ABC transporter solute-binding protein, Zn/Mn family n=1 Tax=Salinispora arenicola TaxID=168697 RepID=UPI003F5CC699
MLHHVEAASSEGVPTVEVGARIDPMDYRDGDSAGLPDPHFWTDPTRVVIAVRILTDEIITHVNGVDADVVRWRAETYANDVSELDAQLAERFAGIPAKRRVLITDHHVLGYHGRPLQPHGHRCDHPRRNGSGLAERLRPRLSGHRDHDTPGTGHLRRHRTTRTPHRGPGCRGRHLGPHHRAVPRIAELRRRRRRSYLDMMRFNTEAIIGGLSG